MRTASGSLIDSACSRSSVRDIRISISRRAGSRDDREWNRESVIASSFPPISFSRRASYATGNDVMRFARLPRGEQSFTLRILIESGSFAGAHRAGSAVTLDRAQQLVIANLHSAARLQPEPGRPEQREPDELGQVSLRGVSRGPLLPDGLRSRGHVCGG